MIEHDGRSRSEWPRDLLDVAPLIEAGWRPHPFREFIVKVTSRCNLSCTYCYVYRSPDQTWREQPVRMSRGTVLKIARRIAEHADTHGLASVKVVLHGGEPLLAGAAFVDYFCRAVRAAVSRRTYVDLCIQTNGTLLDDDRLLAVLLEHHVWVGVSLDGDAATQNARRAAPNGRGSSDAVASGLRRLQSGLYRDLFAGLLCVVDPRTDPVATYEHLLAHEPPAIDFLLPHANWSSPPVRAAGSPTAYGDWLTAVFDRWYGAGSPETSVRLFEEVINGLLGGSSRVESVGLAPTCLIVVETDGSIEQSDALKSAYEGAAHTGLNVRDHSFDAALHLPSIVARQIGVHALGGFCLQCELHPVCGGGFYPHRYQRGSGFLNPSVYCEDLGVLIRHIRARLVGDIEALQVRRAASRTPA